MQTRGTPDPSFRNYPHPDLSVNQVQNLKQSDLRGFHPNMASQAPWQNFSAMGSSLVTPLQTSPSTLSHGSSGLESPDSQEFAHSATSNNPMPFPLWNARSHVSPSYVSPDHRNSCPTTYMGMGRTPMRNRYHAQRQSLNDIPDVHNFDYQQSSELALSAFDHKSLPLLSRRPAQEDDEQLTKLGRLEQMQSEFQQSQSHVTQGGIDSNYMTMGYGLADYQEPVDVGTVFEYNIGAVGLGSFDDTKYMDDFGQPMPGDTH